MHCNDYLQLLSGHLDHTNSEKEEKRLQGHLKNCRHCRALLAQMEANDVLLKDDAIEPPADLTDRIMSQVKKEPRKRRSYRRLVSYAAGGLAAAAMLTLVLTGRFGLPSNDRAAVELPNPLDAATAFYAEAEDALVRQNAADLNDHAAAPAEQDEDGPLYDGDATEPVQDNGPEDRYVGAAEPATEPETQPKSDDIPAPTVLPTEAMSEAAPPESTAAPEQATEPTSCVPDAACEPTTPTAATAPDPTEPPMLTTEDPVLPDLANNRMPPLKREILCGKADPSPDGPLLVLWNAADASLSSYADLEAVELKSLPLSTDSARLFPRFMQALPLIEKSLPSNSLVTAGAEFAVNAYRTSYSTFNSVLLDFIGAYEVAVYYPTTDGDYTQGLVLFISAADA